MKLLVTGANGFLGNYVIIEALRRGHSVRAMVRPAADLSKFAWSCDSRVELTRADLSKRKGLADAIRGADSVVHLAAAKSGDAYSQYQGTVVTSENLLSAMTEAGVKQLVAISSFSVYDFMAVSQLATIDETSPLEKEGHDRDAYAHAKLAQEQVIQDYAAGHGLDLVVVRPGMIWGRDHLLNAWVGLPVGGKIWLRTGGNARIPLTYVENCSEAIVLAAESKAALGQVLNVVDDNLPTQREFLGKVLARIRSRRIVIPVPYKLHRFAAGSVNFIAKSMLKGRVRAPGLLVPSRLEARAKPLQYSNERIKELLEWTPRYTLEEGLTRSVATDPA
jgi:nucleoside-diphosphate-sugar epimerase